MSRLGWPLAAAQLTTAGLRRTGRGGGTAAPGLVADFVDPEHPAQDSARRLDRGVVVVAGTNGKTTTSRMIADMLEADGARVVHNRSGSNLVRGVAAAFAEQTTLARRARSATSASSSRTRRPSARSSSRLQPRVILLNNLFRDQLDRYGELDTIARKWSAALSRLPATTTRRRQCRRPDPGRDHARYPGPRASPSG